MKRKLNHIGLYNGSIGRVIKFYADIPVGTTGEIIKHWIDRQGNEWVTLYFGKNLSGQKLKKSFPGDCVEVLVDDLFS